MNPFHKMSAMLITITSDIAWHLKNDINYKLTFIFLMYWDLNCSVIWFSKCLDFVHLLDIKRRDTYCLCIRNLNQSKIESRKSSLDIL